MSRTNHIFVDFENVHDLDLNRIKDKPVKVVLVLGGHHKSLPVPLVKQLLAYASQVSLVETGRSGKNALDLVLAQHIGEARKTDPHGYFHILSRDKDFDALFTKDKPIIFAFHGYPWLIHRLTYRRTNHRNLHVRGYKEEGTTTTPFDMVVLNDLDRFHLVGDVVDRVPTLGARAAYTKQIIRDKLIDHTQYIATHGDDMPEIANWRWGGQSAAATGSTEADNV